MLKTSRLFLFACVMAASSLASAQNPLQATLHKDPYCGCCTAYADYLEDHDIAVKRVDHANMTPIKQRLGTAQAASCHTVELGDYVIEGHVPVAAIQKMLKERPDIKGIAVPDMPFNSPGMGPEIPGTLPVLALDKNGNVIGEYGKF